MLKLVRNSFGNYKLFFDKDGGEIKWSLLVKLVEYGKIKSFYSMHKMNKKHIEFSRNKMKVVLAVETLSASTANSLQFLMENGEPGFQDAAPTIRFLKSFDGVFDVLNTKDKNAQQENIFKKALDTNNRENVFDLFTTVIDYIKHLKFVDIKDNNKIKLVINSRIRTGFNGFINDMHVIMLMYKEYIENEQLMNYIPVYYLGQNPLEIHFGHNRAMHGFNDNPTIQQFTAAHRKLITFDAILCSKYGNCTETTPNQPISNILRISSRKSISEKRIDANVTDSEIETLYQKLSEIESSEETISSDNLKDYSIACIASQIEHRIKRPERMYCALCKNIFEDNDKIELPFADSITQKPCFNTFEICKETDRFLKLEIMQTIQNFNLIYEAIINRLKTESFYQKTDFDTHDEHKMIIIRSIVDIYIEIKLTQIAKTVTLDSQQELVRSKYKKLIHIYGQ